MDEDDEEDNLETTEEVDDAFIDNAMVDESPTPPPNPYLQNGFFNIVIKNPKKKDNKKETGKKTLFVCDLCDKPYTQNKFLIRHYNLTHRLVINDDDDDDDDEKTTEEKETCEFCEQSVTKTKLKEHYTINHEKNYNNWAVCDYCHKSKDIIYDTEIMTKHLLHCLAKKEKESEEIMLKVSDNNVGKIVNCFIYIYKNEIPIKQIKEHVRTCSRNKSEVVPVKIKKEIQCDLCQKKITYNTALYKHFKTFITKLTRRHSQKKGEEN